VRDGSMTVIALTRFKHFIPDYC